jgi:hypothetical protein
MSHAGTRITRSPITIPAGASATPQMPSLRRRLARLERRCAALWAEEPPPHIDREVAYGNLSEIEHRIVGLLLRSLTQDDLVSILRATERCDAELEGLAAFWSAPRAA